LLTFQKSQRKARTLPKLTKSAKLVSEAARSRLNEIDNTTQKPLFKMRKFQNINTKCDHYNHKYMKESTFYDNEIIFKGSTTSGGYRLDKPFDQQTISATQTLPQ
jgi:hypothetical protein